MDDDIKRKSNPIETFTPRILPALYPKLFADIFRIALIIVSTFFSVGWLWNVHWLIGVILAVPIYLIFLNLFGFLTLPLYDYTFEAKEAREMIKEIMANSQDEKITVKENQKPEKN